MIQESGPSDILIVQKCWCSFLRLCPSRQIQRQADISILLWHITYLHTSNEMERIETKKGDP